MQLFVLDFSLIFVGEEHFLVCDQLSLDRLEFLLELVVQVGDISAGLRRVHGLLSLKQAIVPLVGIWFLCDVTRVHGSLKLHNFFLQLKNGSVVALLERDKFITFLLL